MSKTNPNVNKKKNGKEEHKLENGKKENNENEYANNPNYYKNYVVEYKNYDLKPGEKPAHIYTIQITNSMFTEEICEVYLKYEKAVHKRDRDPNQLQRFLCNSPVYDPERDTEIANSPSVLFNFELDKKRTYKDEGVYPGLGSYFMQHRIDGKLIAVGVIDILKTILHSAYFFYDPDYSFLSMGVVSAIREMEYMTFIRNNFNAEMRNYHLSEMVPTCPKVNYKLNYKPGYVICPRTKHMIKYEEVKDVVEMIA